MNYIVTKPIKSKGIAAILVMLFGGLGLFYSSILGGLLMGIIAPILIWLFLFYGLTSGTLSIVVLVVIFCCLYYVICLIWAIRAVNNYNQAIIANSMASPLNIPNNNYQNTNQDSETIEDKLSKQKREAYADLERTKSLYDQKIISEENYIKQKESLLRGIEILSFNQNAMNTSHLQSQESPYYVSQEFIEEKKKSNLWVWIISILIILTLLYIMYDVKSNSFMLSRISDIFLTNSKDKEEIKNQIEKTYFGIMNGAFTAQNMPGIGPEGMPFYNQNMKSVFAMGLGPFAQLFGGLKIETKNIDVYNFENENTAQVRYDLIISTSNDTAHIDMVVKKIGGYWKLDAEKAFGEKNLKSEKNTQIKRKSTKSISINKAEIFDKKSKLYKVTRQNIKNENGENELISFDGEKSFLVSQKYVYEIDHNEIIGKWKIKDVSNDKTNVYDIVTYEGVYFSLDDFLIKYLPSDEYVSYEIETMPARSVIINEEYINY